VLLSQRSHSYWAGTLHLLLLLLLLLLALLWRCSSVAAMRRVVLLSVLACALFAAAASAAVMDADDAALMELGIDVDVSPTKPAPTYVTVKPPGHRNPLISKFPMLHEIEGEQKRDWEEIQSLLRREPAVAAEENLDLKLDELEEQYKNVDVQPVPSPIFRKEAATPKAQQDKGLMAALGHKLRMAQVGAAPPKPQTPPTGPAAHAAPAAQKRAAVPQVKAAAPAAAAPAKPAAPATKPAAAPVKPATPAGAAAAVSTARLIEKRLRGLLILFKQLKEQAGISAASKKDSATRVASALKKFRDAAAKKKARFAQVDMEEMALAEAEANSYSFAEQAAAVDMEAEAHVNAPLDPEAELRLDAEAIDGILDSIL